MSRTYQSGEPLVAVIIPVYNDEKYISECLDSLLAQTAPYWEAWLADDHSDDRSAEICAEYCRRDSRFHFIGSEKNGSAWACRARGIMSASPSVKYIMFADADDSLTPDAVSTAYEEMKRSPVDILHFGTNIINRGGVSHGRIKNYEKYIMPPICTLRGDEVFESFVRRDFEGHLWNKMFRAELMKNVISRMGAELFLPKAQDKVLYWAVCRSGNVTYRGIGRKLYNYNYGFGTEGGTDTLTMERCRQYLSQAWSENTIAAISEEDNIKYADVMEISRYNLVKHSVRNLLRLPEGERPQGLDLSRSYWDRPLDGARLSCALAEYTWENRNEAAAMLSRCGGFLSTERKPVSVVGTYYHRMDNGGIQRVIARVIEHWHSLGLEVVLFTDFDPTPDDYPLPDYVTRVKLARPFSRCNAQNYRERGMSLARLLKQYNVDCMVYHSYFSDVLLYDTCVCRTEGVRFVLHQHNVFSRYLRYNDAKFSSIPLCAELADAVVCLSGADREWWSCFNPRTFEVLNPLTFDPEKVFPAECDNHTMLFLGRLEEEAKHPLHAVDIAARVVKRIPDAKLLIVGSTGNKDYMKLLKKRISSLGMEQHIILCGFHRDVEEFYRQSSVFLSCSSHEGFMLTLCEAMSYSIPVVMYDLPYLVPVQGNGGIISVPQNSMEAAADAVCRLFSDNELLKSNGAAGRARLDEMYRTDIAAQWRGVFDSLDSEAQWGVPEERRIMARTMVNDYLDGTKNRGAEKPPLMFRIKRYYRQFGLKRSIKRVFEKLAGG